MSQNIPAGKTTFVDINGKPLAGGFVFSYLVGTTTPNTTYQDYLLTIPNTNPIVLDARGQCAMYGLGPYRQIVQDSTGVTIWDQVVLDTAGTFVNTLGNASDPTLGVGLIPSAERVVTNIATLRTLPKTGFSVYVFVEGYYAKGDGGGGHYYIDSTDTTSADNGGTIIVAADGGRWKLIWNQRISVKQFGAKGGSNNDTAAIQAAVNYAVSISTVTVAPYITPTVWFDHDIYGINAPITMTQGIRMEGDRARLLALTGFTGNLINMAGGGTITVSAMFIFLQGLYGDNISGAIRWNARVDGLVFDCNFQANSAIYIERFPYSYINCEVQSSLTDGIQIGADMWGVTLENIVMGNCTQNGIAFLPNAAANGINIKNPRIWGQFLQGYCGINFMDLASCNGVSITGGFIEKVTYGILCGKLCGPVSISGMDFEQCQLGVIRLVGDLVLAGGVYAGPVNISNCFLHAINAAKLYCDSGIMSVEGCRFYTSFNGIDVQTDAAGKGSISIKDCQFPGGVIGINSGANIVAHQNTGVNDFDFSYKPYKINAFNQSYARKVYSFADNPFLQSAGLDFQVQYNGGGTGQYVTQSKWFTTQFDFVTNPNAVSKTIGVCLANYGGQNAFEPLGDNSTSCGEAGFRWSVVYAVTGAINTSDARQKQQIRPLNDAEKAVALRLKGLIRAFKFNDAVEAKGDAAARIHTGVIAQDVKAAFEAEGLVAESYAVLCYDEWEARPASEDAEGNVLFPAVEAGNRYGIRYEELFAFILGAL